MNTSKKKSPVLKHLTFFYRYWKVYKCARSCKIIYRFRLACHRHLKRYRALTTLMDGRWRSGNELISFSLLLVDRYCLSRPKHLVPFPTLMYSWPGLCSSPQWQPIEYKITENQNVVSPNLLSALFYSPFFVSYHSCWILILFVMVSRFFSGIKHYVHIMISIDFSFNF